MNHSTIETKLVNIFETGLLSSVEELLSLAKEGKLADFEHKLRDLGNELLSATAQVVLSAAAQEIEPFLRLSAAKEGLGKLEKRPLVIRIFTGQKVSIPNLYAKKVRRNYKGKRHLLGLYWGIHKQCSPTYLSIVCAMSVLSSSFEITQELLAIQGIKYDSESIRKLVLYVSNFSKTPQAALTKKPNESLAAKRVVIALDGGRTRCRQYQGVFNKAGQEQFSTPWKEPKMFVVTTIDQEAKTQSESVIYGTMFEVDDIFDLLKSHLEGLDIALAKQVQIVADGAVWIWNRTQELLLSLGVGAEKIVETIDYYHASQHLHALLERLSKRKVKKENLVASMKDLLWQGKIGQILEHFKSLFTKKTKEVERDINYFEKNKHRMQYAQYQANKLLAGSGIIESGIRRVINLRFKNTSSFWNQQNEEGLFFIRSCFLTGRWSQFIAKLTTM